VSNSEKIPRHAFFVSIVHAFVGIHDVKDRKGKVAVMTDLEAAVCCISLFAFLHDLY
jgi:hypothetical protein